MNTPAHVVINLVFLSRPGTTRENVAIVAGSLLPDLPIFIFYFMERFVLGVPEREIWSLSYYLAEWQYFIDLFNSVPMIIFGGIVAWHIKARAFVFLCASMLIHVALDFPLHHNDAHRHFLPFSDWRFESPLSYWESAYYGTLIGWVEFALVILGCIILYQRFSTLMARRLVLFIGALYFSYLIYAMFVWG